MFSFMPFRLSAALVLVGGVFALPLVAQAADYPDKPIRLVVPFPPGGSTDVLARLYAQRLGEQLGQTIIVENKPGAGTAVGAAYVSKAPADGYTLLFSGASTFSVNPVLYKSLSYDPQTSFDPLGTIAATSMVLLANPKKVKADTLRQLNEYLISQPETAYASFGNGSTSHFVGEMFQAAFKVPMLHVPYKGSAPAMSDLIGGQVGLSVDTVVAAVPQVNSGSVKALAVSGDTRAPLLPNVPTAAEAGYPSVSYSTWFAVVAPAGLPDSIRKTLQEAVAQSAQNPGLRQQLIDNGYEPVYDPPANFLGRIQQETAQLRGIAERAGIKPQ